MNHLLYKPVMTHLSAFLGGGRFRRHGDPDGVALLPGGGVGQLRSLCGFREAKETGYTHL